MRVIHLPRRKLLPALLILLAVLGVVLFFTLRAGGRPADISADGIAGCVSYLEKLGWQVEPEPVETLQIKLPADLKGYEDYLALQTEQGLPFADCGGKVVCRYTYRVTNYPGGRSDAQVNLLQCDGAVVAGDVVLLGEDGGVFGLEFPK